MSSSESPPPPTAPHSRRVPNCSFLLGAAALVAVPSCADPSNPAASGAPPQAETAAAPAHEVPAHELVVQPVAWPPPSAVDGAARAALPVAAQAAVDGASVPVLVVSQPGALAATKIIARPLWVALSTRFDGVSVYLSATRAAHRYRHLPPATGRARVRGLSAFVTQNTGIWSAAWVEGGVAYALEVECGRRPDPRCDDDRFLLELADELRYVGGVGEGGAP